MDLVYNRDKSKRPAGVQAVFESVPKRRRIMDIRNTRQMKTFAAQRLDNAREGKRIALLFSLITIAVTAAVNIAGYCLSLQIAKTGGLGSMGLRSVLSTVQTLLPILQAVFLLCLNLGYLSAMLRIARGQYASPNGLRLGFDRLWVLLRCELLKGLIYGGIGIVSLYAAVMIFMVTPMSEPAVEILSPLITGASSGQVSLLLDDAAYAGLMAAMRPVLALCGVMFLALSAPLFYRYRMTDYILIDRPGIGAVAALRESRKMMKGSCWKLLRLDLSMWWYYAAIAASAAVCYGDEILPALGISLPISDTAAYFVFFAAYLAAIFAVYYFLRSRVEVTFALAYDSIRPKEPETNGAVLGNIFQM